MHKTLSWSYFGDCLKCHNKINLGYQPNVFTSPFFFYLKWTETWRPSLIQYLNCTKLHFDFSNATSPPQHLFCFIQIFLMSSVSTQISFTTYGNPPLDWMLFKKKRIFIWYTQLCRVLITSVGLTVDLPDKCSYYLIFTDCLDLLVL